MARDTVDPRLTAALVCLAGLLVAVGTAVANHWRVGLALLGGELLLAAAGRAVLAPRRVGLLVVRSRAFDTTWLLATGLAILLLAADL